MGRLVGVRARYGTGSVSFLCVHGFGAPTENSCLTTLTDRQHSLLSDQNDMDGYLRVDVMGWYPSDCQPRAVIVGAKRQRRTMAI